MDYVFIDDPQILEALNPTCFQSPEAFLADLEEKLDSGEITEYEAIDLIADFTARSK